MADIQSQLADQVRGGMRRKNWKQKELAQVVGISPQHLSAMLTGRAEGTLTMWNRLLDALR